MMAVYVGIGIALTVYAWRDISKPWGALLFLFAWPALVIAGLYLIQRDRYEARRGR